MTGSTSASIQEQMAKRPDNMKALISGAIANSPSVMKLKCAQIA